MNGNLKKLHKTDAKIRIQLTVNKIHYTKEDINSVYLPRSSGGRGMIQLQLSYKNFNNGILQLYKIGY